MEKIRSSVWDIVSLRCERNIEMRMSKCLLDELAWDVYDLCGVVVSFTVNLSREHGFMCRHTQAVQSVLHKGGKEIPGSPKEQNLNLPALAPIYIAFALY